MSTLKTKDLRLSSRCFQCLEPQQAKKGQPREMHRMAALLNAKRDRSAARKMALGLGWLEHFGCSGAGLAFRFANVDAALEEGAIFNADAGRGYVAGQGAFSANIDPVGGGDIPANLAQDHNLTGRDAGGHLAVAAHGDAVAGQIDAALDLAVDKQRFGAGDFPFDKQSFADGGLVAG